MILSGGSGGKSASTKLHVDSCVPGLLAPPTCSHLFRDRRLWQLKQTRSTQTSGPDSDDEECDAMAEDLLEEYFTGDPQLVRTLACDSCEVQCAKRVALSAARICKVRKNRPLN